MTAVTPPLPGEIETLRVALVLIAEISRFHVARNTGGAEAVEVFQRLAEHCKSALKPYVDHSKRPLTNTGQY